MLDSTFLFNYHQLWQSYAILSVTTQCAFRPMADILSCKVTVTTSQTHLWLQAQNYVCSWIWNIPTLTSSARMFFYRCIQLKMLRNVWRIETFADSECDFFHILKKGVCFCLMIQQMTADLTTEDIRANCLCNNGCNEADEVGRLVVTD